MAAVGTSLDSGAVLGDRFVLAERLGTGMSSRVFVATDLRRQCRVAVKVLHESLATDPRFVEQFHHEARIAASLQHDNVVAVIDSGEADRDGLSVPYIVTVFMAGGSLASMLTAGQRLDIAQAVAIGRGAADALAYAHSRNVVHRDVKPANLLFDAVGNLRLADFGIARAIASASITEPADSGAGTTRYASPEQVLGRPLDGRSDVYSLALVLMEAVTGTVPLLGDTPAGTMGMRLHGQVDVSTDFGVLRDPLLAASASEAAQRCDAAELVGLLASAAAPLGDPRPMVLVPPRLAEDDTAELRIDRTGGAVKVIGTLAAAATAGEANPMIDLSEDVAAPPDGARASAGRDGEFGRDSITVAEEHHALDSARPARHGRVEPLDVAIAPTPLDDDPSGAGDHRNARPWRRVAAVLLAVLLVAGAAGALWWFVLRVPTHEVPNWLGADIDAATAEAEADGWEVGPVDRTRRDGTSAGQILAQEPPEGTELAEGEQVAFTVSDGPTLTLLPTVSGLPETEAIAAIESAGLVIGARSTTFDEVAPAATVLSASPAEGSEAADAEGRVPKGTPIDIVVSDGPAPRVVPEGLPGVRLADAEAALAAVQLTASVTEEYSDTVEEGVVIRAGTAAGTEVPRDSAVGLVVSAGPEPIVVPDVTGASGSAAASQLEAAGFVVSGIEGSPSGQVLATDPVAGESRPPGSQVRIFTRR